MNIVDVVAKKIQDGVRLSDEDALKLFESPELVEIGRLADDVNRRKNFDAVFFNVNRHINPTNICALSCKFCAYSKKPGEEGGYAYSIDEMVEKAGEAKAQGATEVHMVGGLHPRWRYEHYKDMIKAVKAAHPTLHIKAFTAVELDWLARKARKTVEEVLIELREVGLGSLPGGGAEIFHPEVRDAICETKVSGEQWIDTHRTAHKLGLHSNATMLYGHIESYHHRVDHMRMLRALQDETKGFNAFIPLSFQPFQNEMGIDRYTYGYDDLKTLAIARLYLDNFRHLKAYWIMLGQDVAQLGLQFGANDLDGTVIEEKISRAAGGRAGMAMSRGFIESLVKKGRRHPVERDTLYHPITPMPERPRAGASGDEAEGLVSTALNKSAYGEDLSPSELLALAQRASVHELGRLAQTRAHGHESEATGSFEPSLTLNLAELPAVGDTVQKVRTKVDECLKAYKLAPSTIALDLAEPAKDPGFLVELVWALRHSFESIEIKLLGLKGLWTMAQEEGVTITELLEQLKDAGVDCIESSARETETDLTQDEIQDLHRQIHDADIVTVAKVELVAPTQGPGEPQWEGFLRRVDAFSQLANETGHLLGLSIQASKESFVSSTEYVRAVALARLALTTRAMVIAPLATMPTLSPQAGIGTAKYQHPAEKIASLCLHYGAADLGAIDVEKLNPVAVMKQIRSAGFRPALRDAHLARHGLGQPLNEVLNDVRHAPTVASIC